MKPAVDDVAQEFLGERQLVFGGVGEGGINRDADVARMIECGISFKRDDVGGGRVVEEIGMQEGERWVGQQGDG